MKIDVLVWGVVNMTAIACFTVLAIIFKKWWIILFALLFMFSYKDKENENEKE